MSSVLSASAKGASFLILFQVGSRAFTFVVNQLLLRYLSPELLGASTQLELFSISVLFFSRESLRVALQRQTGNSQAIVNLAYIPVLLGLPLTYLLGSLYSNSALPDVPLVRLSLVIYGIATILELLAEPCFVVAQQKLAYKSRAAAETAATVSRCAVTFGAAAFYHSQGRDVGVLPFAFGQIGYATALLSVYVIQTMQIASNNNFSLLMRKIRSPDSSQYLASLFYRPLYALALDVYIQSGIKYVLTQGDAILITWMTTLQEQGSYALASNYGGLIARMLFQPIEESSRNLFAKLCAAQPNSKEFSVIAIFQAKTILEDIIKFYNLLSLVAWSVGPPIAPLLLQLVAGSRWTDTGAGDVLATYCYYIPLLAFNGVMEAFVSAVASSAQLRLQSMYMGGFFVAFGAASYFFLQVLQLGAQGLVWSNCVNMASRILWTGIFIKKFFANRKSSFDFRDTLPTTTSISTAVGAAAIVRMIGSATLVRALLMKGFVAAVFGIVLLMAERRFFKHCYDVFSARQAPARQGPVRQQPMQVKKQS